MLEFARIQDTALNLENFDSIQAFPECGGTGIFIGTVRDLNDGTAVRQMTLEHYPGMTEAALQSIIDQAKDRWDLHQALIVHRVGPSGPISPAIWDWLGIIMKSHSPMKGRSVRLSPSPSAAAPLLTLPASTTAESWMRWVSLRFITQ